jgi:hypothetical protein
LVKKTRFELTAAFPPQFEFNTTDSYVCLAADLEVGVGSSDKVRKGCEGWKVIGVVGSNTFRSDIIFHPFSRHLLDCSSFFLLT